MPEATPPPRPEQARRRPLRRRLRSRLAPVDVVRLLRHQRLPFALVGAWFGGGATFGAAPSLVRSSEGGGSPFDLLDQAVALDADEPGVYGGWFGYLGYQTAGLVERLPGPPPRPTPMPTWWLGWYDHVVRFDPESGWWFEALGHPAAGHRTDAAFDRWQAHLSMPAPEASPPALTPFVATPGGPDHRKAVRRALDHIAAGDIYQANVCLRLDAELVGGDPVDLFAAGVVDADPRYGAYLDLGRRRAVASLSPELFLRRVGRQVATAPIKGTRPRADGRHHDRDRHDLDTAAKDRAENVMIVDLMRNDLGRVCTPGSITVPRLFDLEAHPGVWHLVSEVTGTLRPGVGDGDLMRATMPPGSVTGAPKVRAMEIIAEVEATGREVYTGAIGGVSPVAGAEWNVAIRTFEVSGSDVWMGVGGGIVADSDPAAELDECTTKAAPLIAAIGAALTPIDRR